MRLPENELRVEACLAGPVEVRVTPAGIPISRCLLDHRSEREEAGGMRRVQFRIRAVASGSDLQRQMAGLKPGDAVRISGFLSRAGYRAADTAIELHVKHIEAVDADG